MLKIVLAECELEPVPKSIRNHKIFRGILGKRPFTILDSNFHHRAMRGLEDSYRRGRPDIAHVCLLSAMDSPLNKRGGLKVYVHTRNDDVIYLDQKWRVPKSYNRFLGLMERLFENKEIKYKNTALLKMEKKTLQNLIKEESEGFDIKLMHYKGAPYVPSNDSLIVIGGFPHGDYKNLLPYPKYSIFSDELVAWSVVNHVIYTFAQ